MGDPAEVIHTQNVVAWGKGGGGDIMMSLYHCISVGDFDSEAFSLQKYTGKTGSQNVATPGGLPEYRHTIYKTYIAKKLGNFEEMYSPQA